MKKFLLPIIALALLSAKKDTAISFNGKELENSLSLIPMTSTNFPPPEFSPADDSKSSKEKRSSITISESSFYISKYEVSNGQYLIYLKDLSMNGKKDEYDAALPDTSVWNDPKNYNEAYSEYYLRHPAYRDYPVVGVSYDQSKKYCEWLTQKYAKEIKKKYPNAVFKLPTVKQWYVAACGGHSLTNYPWGDAHVKNKKGEWMANFITMPDNCIYRDEKTNEYKVGWSPDYSNAVGPTDKAADITAPVIAYYPNAYGLYNMSGNVSEFVEEKGITKGGSWKDPAYYLQTFVEEKYDTLRSASADRGFRFVMELVK